MLAAFNNLPKWLLVIIAIGVFGSQFEQIDCKGPGCDSASLAQSAAGADGGEDSSSTDTGDDCSCQCHFGMVALLAPAPRHITPRSAHDADVTEGFDHAPDSPCAEIDHPPQLA